MFRVYDKEVFVSARQFQEAGDLPYKMALTVLLSGAIQTNISQTVGANVVVCNLLDRLSFNISLFSLAWCSYGLPHWKTGNLAVRCQTVSPSCRSLACWFRDTVHVRLSELPCAPFPMPFPSMQMSQALVGVEISPKAAIPASAPFQRVFVPSQRLYELAGSSEKMRSGKVFGLEFLTLAASALETFHHFETPFVSALGPYFRLRTLEGGEESTKLSRSCRSRASGTGGARPP